MTMIETLLTLLSCLAGMALGIIFYAGLWWTVRRGVASPRPALWFSGSLLLRMSIALAGIYFVSAGNWRKLAARLAGFVLARLAVMWLTRTKVNTSGGRTCILLPTR
jgi:F1F0 ATPase subunit 2